MQDPSLFSIIGSVAATCSGIFVYIMKLPPLTQQQTHKTQIINGDNAIARIATKMMMTQSEMYTKNTESTAISAVFGFLLASTTIP